MLKHAQTKFQYMVLKRLLIFDPSRYLMNSNKLEKS